MSGSLADYTTFGIGGGAKHLVCAKTSDELMRFSEDAVILGGGSNVLVSDDGYDGTVLINRYSELTVSDNVVTVGSGTRMSTLARRLAADGLCGLEWAVGIPGSVGGAVRMNAGAFGSDISEHIVYADILSGGGIVRRYLDELMFSYRSSAIADGEVVVSAAFSVQRTSRRAAESKCREYAMRRAASQPHAKSAGSVFKNPPGLAIGRLIEEAGFKGYRVGDAMVSHEHANIIVNLGKASAHDVCAIINLIKTELLQKGVTAEEEIIYIGEF